MRRIVILGNTGSGKTTLAKNLSARLNVPHVELDALSWGPNWTPVDISVLRERTTTAVNISAWVVDGNYGQVRDIIWPRADTLVWLDLPLMLIWWQLIRRTAGRMLSRESLWTTNNRESLQTLFSHNSLFRQSVRMHRKHRREYPSIVEQPQYAHLNMIRLTLPNEVSRWLETVPKGASNSA